MSDRPYLGWCQYVSPRLQLRSCWICPNGESAEYSWGSAQVLAPLIIGLIGLVVSGVFQRLYVKEPTVPFEILSNRTSVVGYITNFLHGLIVMAVVYYLPVVSKV
jgi:hypothetical protein